MIYLGNRIEKKSKGTSARKTLEELAGLTEKLDAEAEGIDHPETGQDEWTTTEYVNDSNMEYALRY